MEAHQQQEEAERLKRLEKKLRLNQSVLRIKQRAYHRGSTSSQLDSTNSHIFEPTGPDSDSAFQALIEEDQQDGFYPKSP